MAENNGSNQDFLNNSDGFSLTGGTTRRTFAVTGGNVTLTGGNAQTYTFPSASDTLVGRASIDTLTNKTISGVTIADATNIVLNTTTGTKIGTATTQKMAFYNATPVVQPTATTDLGTVLSSVGLRASGTAYPITTSGAVNISGAMGVSAALTVSALLSSTATVRSNSTSLTAATTLNIVSSTEYQLCSATSAAFTVTLPATTTAGFRFTIKKTDSSTNAVTVAGTIDGATNYSLAAQYKYVTVISTTTSGTWYIVANN